MVVPESLADRPNRRALDGQADEDTARPDRLDVFRRVLERQGCSLWLELAFDGPAALPGLPPPDSAEAVRRGLVRLDGTGNAVGRPTIRSIPTSARRCGGGSSRP